MQFYHIKRRENWLNICGTNCLIWLIKVNRDFDVHAVIEWIQAKRASDWFGLHKQARISWSREIVSLCLSFSVSVGIKIHTTMNFEVNNWHFQFLEFALSSLSFQINWHPKCVHFVFSCRKWFLFNWSANTNQPRCKIDIDISQPLLSIPAFNSMNALDGRS